MNARSVLSVVIPCYNEEKSLEQCVARVLAIEDETLALEVIIVDDCSRDRSADIAKRLAQRHANVRVAGHQRNQGKGAALRTGFRLATGDFVAIQDADLEYDPRDLRRLVAPLLDGEADVVFGSRFVSGGLHRVLYFWHSVGNRVLTLLSNMFTDLNLTDMETCYKVFRAEVVRNIDLCENRFGFEPEIVARVAAMRLRIYEMGISYRARTYEEGKKIGAIDGLRALYCIVRYNACHSPAALQFVVYAGIGGVAALANLFLFMAGLAVGLSVPASASTAFVLAAAVNYWLGIHLVFRHNARWRTPAEIGLFGAVVAATGLLDVSATLWLIGAGMTPLVAKSLSSILCLGFNFVGRRYLVFPEATPRPWLPQGALDSPAVDSHRPAEAISTDAVQHRSRTRSQADVAVEHLTRG